MLSLPVERRPPPHESPRWLPVLLRPMEVVRAEQEDADRPGDAEPDDDG
ncbi:MAG: hypothetical protein R3263_10060 [Myxococcota bacterium]|nr:hypothetical protein [Myxococcota bacterium]